MKVLDFGRAPLFLFLFQGTLPIIIYRVSNVYLTCIYRISIVIDKGLIRENKDRYKTKITKKCVLFAYIKKKQ